MFGGMEPRKGIRISCAKAPLMVTVRNIITVSAEVPV